MSVENIPSLYGCPTVIDVVYSYNPTVGAQLDVAGGKVTVETRSLNISYVPTVADGYSFGGWVIDCNSNGIVDSGDFMLQSKGNGVYAVPDGKALPAQDTVAIAKLNEKNYKVSFSVLSEEYSKLYQGNGPVLTVKKIELAEKPQQEVATFY